MSKASALCAAQYVTESTFGEDATPTIRMPILDTVDLSGLTHAKVAAQRAVQYMQDDTPHITTIQGGSFRTRFYLTGHGSSTSGATALTSLATLLQHVFGAAVVSAASGTTATGGTATAVTTAASATFAAGSLCRIGTGAGASDARGGGQFAAITSHVTTTLNLLTAIGAAPTNGDVVYSAEMVHTLELPASLAAVTGLSWRLFTANLQVDCHGCYASSLTLNLPVNGDLPTIEIEWQVAWWEYISATFPTATAMEEFTPAPSGPAGSFYFQAKGTATRATRTPTALTISIATNIVPLMAPGGVGQYQACVGARRTPMEIMWEWEEEAPAASTTPQSDTDWDEQKHALYTLNSVIGRAVGVYSPRLIPADQRPVQHSTDGLNRQRRRYKAVTGDTRTTDLTASALRIALA
jgi:hypothetical protein